MTWFDSSLPVVRVSTPRPSTGTNSLQPIRGAAAAVVNNMVMSEHCSLPGPSIARPLHGRRANARVGVRCNAGRASELPQQKMNGALVGKLPNDALGASSRYTVEAMATISKVQGAVSQAEQTSLVTSGSASTSSSWTYFGLNNIITSFTRRNAAPSSSGSAVSTSAVSSHAIDAPVREQQRDTLVIVPPSGVPASDGPNSSGSRGLFRRASKDKAKVADEVHHPTRSNHPTLHLLRQRAREGSQPGARDDGFKLGLVVEGGGMRGAVTGGALIELLHLGMRGCFDAVYGSSAGAINSTFFLAGQEEGVNIYAENIANKRFCDVNRLMKGPGPVLDLDYLLEHVMHHEKPLDWDAVIASPVPLKIVASSLDQLSSVTMQDFKDKDDLLCCLRASANIPEIVGGPMWHRGHRLVDAAVFEPVPFQAAIADGCTHVLALCSRPPVERGTWGSYFEDVFSAAIKRAVMSPAYMKDAWRAEVEMIAQQGATMDDMLLQGLQVDAHQLPFFRGPNGQGVHVCPVYPGAGAKYAPVCIVPEVLHAGVVEGRRTVQKMLTPHWHLTPEPPVSA